jgi:ATP-dependent Lhr-like helicase
MRFWTLEERRVQAVFVPRGLDGAGAPLDMRVVDEVLEEIHPPATNVDEVHDALLLAGFLFDTEAHRIGGALMPALLDELSERGRVRRVAMGSKAALVIVERAEQIPTRATDADVLAELLRARLEVYGPRPPAALAEELGVPLDVVEPALARLERTGEVLRGHFDGSRSEDVVWSKRLVTRVRRRMLEALRAQIAPVHARDLVRFLFAWHRLDVPDEERPAKHS